MFPKHGQACSWFTHKSRDRQRCCSCSFSFPLGFSLLISQGSLYEPLSQCRRHLMTCQLLPPVQILPLFMTGQRVLLRYSHHRVQRTRALETSSDVIHSLSSETQGGLGVEWWGEACLWHICTLHTPRTQHISVEKPTPVWSMWEGPVGEGKQYQLDCVCTFFRLGRILPS